MLHTNELKEGIALVEKGLVHGPGNSDLLDVLEQVRACLYLAARGRWNMLDSVFLHSYFTHTFVKRLCWARPCLVDAKSVSSWLQWLAALAVSLHCRV